MSRNRSSIFSPLEKEVLIELVNEKKDVMESKLNNAKMVYLKEEGWKELALEFNSRPGVSERTDKQLKTLWKNLKTRARSDAADARVSMMEPEGGLSDASVDSTLNKPVAETEKSMPIKLPFVLDKHQHKQSEEVKRPRHLLPKPSSTPTEQDILKNMITSVMTLQSLHKEKEETNDLDGDASVIQMANREHKRKMEMMEAEHQSKMEYLNAKRRRKEELYDLKTEILMLQKQDLLDKSTNILKSPKQELLDNSTNS